MYFFTGDVSCLFDGPLILIYPSHFSWKLLHPLLMLVAHDCAGGAKRSRQEKSRLLCSTHKQVDVSDFSVGVTYYCKSLSLNAKEFLSSALPVAFGSLPYFSFSLQEEPRTPCKYGEQAWVRLALRTWHLVVSSYVRCMFHLIPGQPSGQTPQSVGWQIISHEMELQHGR